MNGADEMYYRLPKALATVPPLAISYEEIESILILKGNIYEKGSVDNGLF
jgi:hypothetical protein